MNATGLLDETFGADWLRIPLFYSRDAALRFELGTGTHAIDRMCSAIDRAWEIFRGSLGSAGDLQLILVIWGDSSEPQPEALSAIARRLDACGLPRLIQMTPRVREFGSVEDAAYALTYCVPVNDEQARRALWANIASDLGITPHLRETLFLASCARGILLHAYDDRGMDLIGSTVAAVRPIYQTFRAWLLNHDLPKMNGVFES